MWYHPNCWLLSSEASISLLMKTLHAYLFGGEFLTIPVGFW